MPVRGAGSSVFGTPPEADWSMIYGMLLVSLWFWVCAVVLAVVMAFVADAVTRYYTWSIFWRAYCSCGALMVVASSWIGWAPAVHPLVVSGLLVLSAGLAVSLAAEVADIHPSDFLQKLAALWMLLCVGLLVVCGVLNAPLLIQRMQRDVGGTWFPWLMVLVVGTLGCIAHVFKRFNQRFYGATEVLFGLSTMYKLATSWTRNEALLAEWAVVVGSAYIVARGLNNWHEAAAKPGPLNVRDGG